MNIRKLVSRFTHTPSPDEVEIPTGPITVHVQGEAWRSKSISSIKFNTPVKFSATPKNSYQIDANWPEGNFFNINTYPASETTRDNWIGFVSYEGKPTATQIATLVKQGKPISVWGYYEMEDGEINTVLTIPRTLE